MEVSIPWMSGASGGSYNSERLLREPYHVESCLSVAPKKITLGSCGFGFSYCFYGACIWKKFHIPDSVLLVHSKIATISENSSARNRNGFRKILSPLPGIKNASSGGGGSHFRLPYVSTPQCFNVQYSPEIRWWLTQHLALVLILSNKLLTQAS